MASLPSTSARRQPRSSSAAGLNSTTRRSELVATIGSGDPLISPELTATRSASPAASPACRICAATNAAITRSVAPVAGVQAEASPTSASVHSDVPADCSPRSGGGQASSTPGPDRPTEPSRWRGRSPSPQARSLHSTPMVASSAGSLAAPAGWAASTISLRLAVNCTARAAWPPSSSASRPSTAGRASDCPPSSRSAANSTTPRRPGGLQPRRLRPGCPWSGYLWSGRLRSGRLRLSRRGPARPRGGSARPGPRCPHVGTAPR